MARVCRILTAACVCFGVLLAMTGCARQSQVSDAQRQVKQQKKDK